MSVLGPFDFRGGLCNGYDFTSFPQGKGYASLMQNCYIKEGCVVARWGTTQVNSVALGSPSTVVSLKLWQDTVNAVLTLISTSGSKIYTSADIVAYIPQTDDGGGTIVFTDRTGAITISGSVFYIFDSLNNILVGAGNSSSSVAPFKITAWNANAAALGGSPPFGDIAKQVNNFMFLSRNLSATTTQSKVYWSNVNDPETWTAANVLDFSKNDGEPVMALGSIGTDLYIFKKTSIGRLSTVTITTSGAVTLGPLVTVIKGIGCCGPRALDNLPNGNIIFVGFDGHFYEFDGSTTIDRSKMGYPGINVFDTAFYAASPGPSQYYGFSSCLSGTSTMVKTIKGKGEAWITFVGSAFNNGYMTFVYDFLDSRWFDNPIQASFQNTAMEELPLGNILSALYPFEATSSILMGSTSGIILSSGNSIRPYFENVGGSSLTMRVATIIRLMGPDGPIIPRSLCLDVDCPSTTTGATLGTFSITIGFDRFDAPTTVYSSSATTVPNRIVAPISYITDPSGTNIFPTYLTVQINWTGTGSGSTTNVQPDIVRIGNLWISDEIIR